MGQAEWGLVTAIGGMLALVILAVKLVWCIWAGRRPTPLPLGLPFIVAIAASILLAAGNPVSEPTLVAGVVAQESGCRAASSGRIEVQEHGDRATVAGALDAGSDCSIWAAIQDQRTGTYWLQGPATVDGSRWSLELVVGLGASTTPLTYRATVFATSGETGSAWQAMPPEHRLTLGELPPPQTWLADGIALGTKPNATGARAD